ncbi:MAG: hypothetical protein HOJ90_04910 [Alphaproteobacteria bacterium]|jgi:maleate isomerase|nr:hypothetical protein [Alphaproteobacteria bacterium]
MQPEYEAMRPEGINNQMYRFSLARHDKTPDAVLGAVPDTRLCWPDVIIGGNSMEMHPWSHQLQDEYRAAFQERAEGVKTVLATDATLAALKTIGAKRFGVLSPMSVENSKHAQAYYEGHGFEVPYTTSLMVKRSEDIIKVTVEQAIEAFEEINKPDVDTLVHVGGALGIVSMIEELEERFQKPIISVNAATYWYALRQIGVNDPMPGFGKLLMNENVASN